MNKNELKKYLYRENPVAELLMVRMGNVYYMTNGPENTEIRFTVPVDDMGDTDFLREMPAKLLIRWMDEPVSQDENYTHCDYPHI